MKIKELIESSNNIVILSGAGVSTASGLKDFRSQSGLYSKMDDPTLILSRDYYNEYPQKTIDYIIENFTFSDKVDANLGHHFAYDVFKMDKLLGVITQNVDGLYYKTKLPSEYIVEIHGSANKFTCTNCNEHLSNDDINSHNRSSCCDAILDTDIILYGDNFEYNNYQRYMKMLAKADLIIVMGTSLNISAHSYNIMQVKKKALINNESIQNYGQSIFQYEYIGKINPLLKEQFYNN